MNKPYNRNFQRKRDLHKINRFISNENVRVILEDGEQLGVMTTKDAIELAQSRGVDLVEIAPNNDPPVCKIIDYGKFKYQEQKKKNEAKKKQKVMETKEVKIRPGTGDHDYDVKLRNARKFISEGNRVKFSLRFKGREMEHSNLGIAMLLRLKQDLIEVIRVEMEPKIEGRQAFLVVAPK
ncbi:MAG: translation initiation factor IF-3 [Alphaproteobacteria bacterium]|nr:translation initiation factor IF-3 [Alphaproteobacteria bacterium]MDG2007791.1 translation initiation factor IF-3 [Alphaproteobacteria bacterium]